jgi:hypothetical protein
MTAPLLRNRVITASSPRMAAQDTFNTEITAIKQSMKLQCFNHVL